MEADKSARNRLRGLRDFSKAYGHRHALAEAHRDLAYMCIVMFGNQKQGARRLGRCMSVLRGHRARILATMSEPCMQGYSAAVASIARVDQMLFDLQTRIHVAAAVEAVESMLAKEKSHV